MKTRKTSRWLAILAVLTAVSCENTGTVAVLDEELTLEDEIALQAL